MIESISDEPTKPTLTKNITTLLPKKIGPYKIESLLKKGGMSILYLATHPKTARPIVVKVLSPNYIKNKDAINRFLKEADIIRLSNHPNIIKLFSEGAWDQGLYIAMEFIQGVSLKQFLLEKSFSIKKALEIILQVSYALCHLHTYGIIHRDLKPENILITENGQTKVIDFGIAQLVNEKPTSQKPHFIGTPHYMSPEQKEDPSIASFSSDIYSLAIITYELILGKLSHGTIHLSLIPNQIRVILEKALNSDPKKRYLDIVDFITDLSQYLKNFAQKEEALSEEKYDDIYEIFNSTNFLFIKKDPPNWKQIEVAFKKITEGPSIGIYLDFFQLSDNIFLAVLLEAEKKDLKSYIHTSILRGYVKMAIDIAKMKKDFLPSTILNIVNDALIKDDLFQKFNFIFMVFNLNHDQILYSNSSNFKIFHLNSALQKISTLSINNSLLGENNNSSFVETAINFNVSDRIILLSKKVQAEKQEELKKVILNNILFSPKHEIETISHEFKNYIEKKENESLIALCMQRKV